ncbi:hypothetical protein CRM22_011268, partial [Opisthorchis felineus]
RQFDPADTFVFPVALMSATDSNSEENSSYTTASRSSRCATLELSFTEFILAYTAHTTRPPELLGKAKCGLLKQPDHST